MNQHCTLCGCTPSRPCHSIGIGAEGDRQHPPAAPEAPAAFTCRILPNGRCTRCQKCEGCGDPIGADPEAQLVLVGRRKHRLCGSPRPCECEEGPGTLEPCALRYTGDLAFDAFLEADRFADPVTASAALDAWIATLGWSGEERARFTTLTQPIGKFTPRDFTKTAQ